jgi:type IV pilus assembly protein PilM
MAKSIVGLDISRTSIRAVEVTDPTKSRPTVVRFAEVATPPESVSNGEVIEPNTVAGAIRSLWKAGRFRSRNVVLGVGNQRVLSRDLTVPAAPLPQIRESLPFQVQDMLPVPVVDAILDFYPIAEEASESGPVIRGLLVAAVKDAVLANVKAVQLAGLNPAGVDLIPFALSRAVITRQHVPGTVAMVAVGAETTSVVIATAGVPQFVRIIPTGGAEITKALAARLQIDWEAAELVKRHIGFGATVVTEDDRRAALIVREVSGELLSSIRNTVNYFVNTHPSSGVTQVLLAGGGAALPGFTRAVADYTALPTSAADPWADLAFAKSINRQDVADRGASIAVAYGLAVGSKAA